MGTDQREKKVGKVKRRACALWSPLEMKDRGSVGKKACRSQGQKKENENEHG